MQDPQLTIVIVSFNTRELLRECIASVRTQCTTLEREVIVVDNASEDGSAQMVSREFPEVRIIGSDHNLGFAAANNRAFSVARGRYVVMLNSDARLHSDALLRSVAHMEANPRAGLASGRLIDLDGVWKPSARLFPSPLNKLLTMSGLAERYRRSRLFGRFNRTWANPLEPAQVDWVGGAYMIVRRDALEQVGYFDERFFLYFEEVDLCRRIKTAGYEIWFWPDVIVTHVGGASTKLILKEAFSPGAQIDSWRMRGELLYYRKYHGELGARTAMSIETWWHRARALRNSTSLDRLQASKVAHSRHMVATMLDAWRDTQGGTISPPPPWTISDARHANSFETPDIDLQVASETQTHLSKTKSLAQD